MKADNEPAISLPTLFKSVKNENMFKTTNESKKTKENEKKKNSKEKKKERKKKFPLVGIEPQTIDVWDHRYIYCATP